MNSNRVFHHKPSILGYPYFWKHLYIPRLPNTKRKVIGPKKPTSKPIQENTCCQLLLRGGTFKSNTTIFGHQQLSQNTTSAHRSFFSFPLRLIRGCSYQPLDLLPGIQEGFVFEAVDDGSYSTWMSQEAGING